MKKHFLLKILSEVLVSTKGNYPYNVLTVGGLVTLLPNALIPNNKVMMSTLKIQKGTQGFLRKTKRRPFIPWMITAQMSLVKMKMLKYYSWD